MTRRLRILRALLAGYLPPRCYLCRRHITGHTYSSSHGARDGYLRYRCYPHCQTSGKKP